MIDYDAIAEVVSPNQLASSLGAEKHGAGWRCPLPDHDDIDPSFSFFRDGSRTAGKCHGCGGGGSPVGLASVVWGVSRDEAAKRLVRDLGLVLPSSNGAGRDGFRPDEEIAAEYEYTDESGKALFQVIRFENPKTFRPRHRCPGRKNGWTRSLGSGDCGCPKVQSVLYRLPKLIEAVAAGKPIYVVEGEKDVHAIEGASGVATCNPMGAGKWRPEYNESLRGAHIRIIADRDEPGMAHAGQVAKSLADIAADIKVLEPKAGKDAHDHLKAGFGLDDFVAVDAVEPRVARLLPAPMGIHDLFAVEDQLEDWLVEGLVPASGNVLLAGYPKTFKTMLLIELGVALATGTLFLGRFNVPRRRRVGLVLMEDQASRVARRIQRICASRNIQPDELEGCLYLWFRPPLRFTDQTVHELGDYAGEFDLDLLAVDSWAYVASGDSNSSDEVTPQLQALSGCREQRAGLTVLLTHHARKTQGEPTDRLRITDVIRNSSAFGAWYDAGIVLSRRTETSPVTVQTELRDSPSPEPFTFEVADEHPSSPATGYLPSGSLRLTASSKDPSTHKRLGGLEKLVPAVRDFLAKYPDGVNRTQLRKVPGSNVDVEAAFRFLEETGEAVCTPAPGPGLAANYALLPNPAEPCRTPAEAGSEDGPAEPAASALLPNPAEPCRTPAEAGSEEDPAEPAASAPIGGEAGRQGSEADKTADLSEADDPSDGEEWDTERAVAKVGGPGEPEDPLHILHEVRA